MYNTGKLTNRGTILYRFLETLYYFSSDSQPALCALRLCGGNNDTEFMLPSVVVRRYWQRNYLYVYVACAKMSFGFVVINYGNN